MTERARGEAPLVVQAGPPDPADFSPYGAFIEPPTVVGERAHFGEWLEPVSGRVLRSHLNRVTPASLPSVVDRVERHPFAAQLFLPVDVSRYLVTVMPSREGGDPDPARARAFVVPGHTGVAYRPDTWHAGISVLDREGSFGVFMWRGGEEDDVFVTIPTLEVRLSSAVAKGGARG